MPRETGQKGWEERGHTWEVMKGPLEGPPETCAGHHPPAWVKASQDVLIVTQSQSTPEDT